MGGLANLFKKIIPFITLICFVCFGITYAFKDTTNKQLTYLTTQYYDKESGNIIKNPTKDEQENAEKLYTFDVVEYTKNIDQNILTRSTTNIIDLKAYQTTLNNFNDIWADGYQFGDVINTILNAVIMVINTIILIINVALFPSRIISGILLTGISLIGININNGVIIIPFLKFLIDKFRIPFIQPTNQKASYDNALTDTYWTWNINKLNNTLNTIPYKYNGYDSVIKFSSLDTGTRETIFDSFYAEKTGNKITIKYLNSQTRDSIEVYNGGWIKNNAKTIHILGNNWDASKVAGYTTELNKAFNQVTRNNIQRQPQQRIYRISNKNDYYLQYC